MEEKDPNGAAPDEKWKMAVEGRGNCINRNVGTYVENHVQGKSGATVGERCAESEAIEYNDMSGSKWNTDSNDFAMNINVN